MTRSTEERQFTIKADPETMRKFERFLALLHWNSRHGHSAVFAMHLDGDGEDGFTCIPEPRFREEVEAISSVGRALEVATSQGMYCAGISNNGSKYQVRSTATLYKDGEAHKTVPRVLRD